MTATDVWSIAGAILATFGGSTLIVLGLSRWLGQVWAARILEQERARHAQDLEHLKGELERLTRQMQARLEKTVYVHRLQFETEFKAIEEVWAKLSRVRAALGAVRPTMSVGPIDETPDQKREGLFRRINDLVVAYNPARRALDDQSPFYPEDIYCAADAAMQTAHVELINVQTDHQPFRTEWWDRGAENKANFERQMDELSAKIRKRLAELAVYPSEA